ncbi:MAG TPA: ATP synthase F1 subunit gamma [Alphaproteobacteria bacterium]|nr:ATP synthase F1 subunit gamma [Alphaproteobacteria bacterium]
MASLKELRSRLSSVKSTEKITTAMKLVAASRLRKAQTALEKNNNYTTLIENTVARILVSYKKEEIERKIKHILPPIFAHKKNTQNYVLIVFSSERGLCGSYNQNVAKAAAKRVQELKKQGKNVKIVCYGKKAYDILKKNYADLIAHHEASFASGGIFYDEAIQMIEKIMNLAKKGGFDVVEIVHSSFKTAVSREMVAMQIYPLKIDTQNLDEHIDHVGDAYFDYKPSREEVLEKTANKLLTGRVFRAMLSAEASEQGARMMAMDNATQNAKEMIKDLTLKYNTIRQSAITTELNEIISGAEAI